MSAPGLLPAAVTGAPANGVVLLRNAKAPDPLDWLCSQIRRNRFLPLPPPDRLFVGDGDFLAIGTEFLRHFVRLGGLKPEERVLEIGCGIGRMALPLTQYLTTGSYDGVDIVADGIRWCDETIAPAYPAFRFHRIDAANGRYNPAGKVPTAAVTLPFADASFDFALLTSVVTHLRAAETMRYAAELGRLLRPGGRCFLSLFLMTAEAKQALAKGGGRLGFDPQARGPEFIADPAAPEAAIAYDARFLLDLFATQGLVPARPPLPGHWSGVKGPAHYQDLLLLVREGTP